VLINRAITGYSYVVEDAEAGAKAADVLLHARRSNLCVLHGRPVTQITQARLNGFLKRASGRTGGPAKEIIANALTESAAYEAVQAALAGGMKFNGLYAVTDGLAMGAYPALKQHGLKIPRDVAVLGVGDYDISPFFEPPLSIVGVEHKKIAEEASRLMARLLQRGGMDPEHVVVPVGTVLRAST
jgi:LacI family transcriptional regulator